MTNRITLFVPLDIVVNVGKRTLGPIEPKKYISEVRKSIDTKYGSIVNSLKVRFNNSNVIKVVVNNRTDVGDAQKIRELCESVGSSWLLNVAK